MTGKIYGNFSTLLPEKPNVYIENRGLKIQSKKQKSSFLKGKMKTTLNSCLILPENGTVYIKSLTN